MKASLGLACLVLLLAAPLAAGAAPPPLVSWSFQREADAAGWQHADLLAPPAVSGGALRFTAGSRDPILLTPLVHIATAPYQRVEIHLASDRPGTAELFWAPTTEGRYGGFDQGRSLRFHVAAGEHRYRLYPFWHTDKQIVRLRLDPPSGADVALYGLYVTALPPSEATGTRWDFTHGQTLGGWAAAQGLDALRLTPGGLATRSLPEAPARQVPEPEPGGSTPTPLLFSPRLDLELPEAQWVTVRMQAAGEYGEVWAITDQPPGVVKQPFTFGLAPAGRAEMRTYTTPLAFGGRLLGLALVPTHRPGQPIVIESVAVGDRPAGRASLREVFSYLEDPLPRVGRTTELVCVVTNQGGEPAGRVSARATLPGGVDLLSPAEQAGPESLAFGDRHAFRWPVVARMPVEGDAEVTVRGQAADGCRCSTGLLISRAPAVEAGDYVPRPHPAATAYEIGMYYFPGWPDAAAWAPIQRACFPRPVLGYYREGDPEVADWHIKWAVEHGIDFFIYDWYWVQGSMQLTHGLDAYFRSRHHPLLKFCLLWANHNPPGTSSEEDLLAVTRFWIENYFRRPEYKTVDGKPMVVIFAPGRLREDMGSAAVRDAFDKMRALCREAGLPGIYLVACAGSPGALAGFAREGYDAASAYNYPGAGSEGRRWAPYDTMVTGFDDIWREMRATRALPYLLPLSPGWDNRPWAGDNAAVRYGSTPAKFREMCRRARRLMDASQGVEAKMAFVEAWNEWGEGSYAEPAGRWQFGYLDALRDVFTDAPSPHTDLGPRDLGLGPYNVEWPRPQTAWEFDTEGDLEGWTRHMQLSDVRVEDGTLRGTATGGDPAFFGPPVSLDAGRFRRVRVRMRVSEAGLAQLFWSTDFFATSEATSVRFPTTADDEFHTYTINVGANPTWVGTIRSLRLDPSGGRGAAVEVDFVRPLP